MPKICYAHYSINTIQASRFTAPFIRIIQKSGTIIALGAWADVLIIAPASAQTLSKMAHGLCDNFLLSVFLSIKCPVYFAPAMDLDMLAHPATQKNIDILVALGNHLIDSEVGELASGLNGKGRMAEPETIVGIIREAFNSRVFSSKKVLITSGPTYESLDSVRFIGNHSSGKMGYALALCLPEKVLKLYHFWSSQRLPCASVYRSHKSYLS